MHEENCLSGL